MDLHRLLRAHPLTGSIRLALLGIVLLASVSTPLGVEAAKTRADPVWGGVVRDAPGWLSMPEQPNALYSEYEFEVVAGRLINAGIVDAHNCPNGGFAEKGEANKCGLSTALPKVYQWQNQFNAEILSAGRIASVPPILMKNVFAWESQFWPVTVYINTKEYGLGHLTEMGADSALRWNSSFYADICVRGLTPENCRKPYEDQPENLRATLRGLVIQQVRADCGNCEYGLDLALAKRSTRVFANVLLANARFVKQAVLTTTGKSAADVLTYEDFWKYTLTSYNAGPGCFSGALERTVGDHATLDWRNLAARLEPGCRGAVPYVRFVSDTAAYYPENDPGGRPTPSTTAAPTGVTATQGTPTATSTAGGTTEPQPTSNPSATGTPVDTHEPTSTPIPSSTEPPTREATQTGTVEGTHEPTATASLKPTEAQTEEPTATGTAEGTGEPNVTATLTSTEPPTQEATATATVESTDEATGTVMPTVTATPVETAIPTGTVGPSASPTAGDTPAHTKDASATGTPTATAAGTEPAGETPLGTGTALPTDTPTETATPTATSTGPTATPTVEVTDLPPDEHAPDQIIVKFRGFPASLLAKPVVGLVGAEEERELPGLGALLLKVPADKLAEILSRLQANPLVEYAELNYVARPFYTPTDPIYPNQGPYMEAIQASSAWDLSQGAGVVVAVVDTGVDTSHPDLAANIWQNAGETGTDSGGNDKRSNAVDDDGNGFTDDWQGWNFVGSDNAPADYNGHGTHSAGIIAAAMDNAEGIAGIAPQSRIMPIKAVDNTGYGTYADVAQAIIYAVDEGARVIDLGFGGTGDSQALLTATDYAYAHGALVVAAAGNSGGETTYYPAANPNVVAVSAVDGDLTLAPFSSYGSYVSLAAPGTDIYGTLPGGEYAQMSGTSMSAAEASGLAALLAALPQFSSPAGIREALLGSALDLGEAGPDSYFGNGLLQALGALNYVPGVGTATPTPTLSATVTVTATGPARGGGGRVMSLLALWGTAQNGTNCAINNPANSIDLAFNNWVADCSLSADGDWTYAALSDVSFPPVGAVTLDVRFYADAWPDGTLTLAVSNDDGANFHTLATYGTDALPPASLQTVSFDVSPDFTSQAEVNNAQVRLSWAGAGAARTLYVDEVRLSVAAGANPTPTLPVPGPLQSPAPNNPHGEFNGSSEQCAGCHSTHAAVGPAVLNSAWPEESVCFSCHTSGGIGTDVQPAFTSYLNTATRFFKHDVAMNAGFHSLEESDPTAFGGANRHVECIDCHNAHDSGRDTVDGATQAPFTLPQMRRVSGVDPDWTAAGSPYTFSLLDEARREYQICFKCHSSYTELPNYQPDGWDGVTYVLNGLKKLTTANASQVRDTRDLAEAFNPYNASYHPVVAQGKNTVMPDSFVAGRGLTTESMIRCSDCHTNADPANGANGTHGSPNLHLLDGDGNYTTVDNGNGASAGELCFKCHREDVYGPSSGDGTADLTRFHESGTNLHARHVASGALLSCYACHNTHGSQQLRLINFDVGVAVPDAGYNSVTAWQYDGTTASCFVGCHETDPTYNP